MVKKRVSQATAAGILALTAPVFGQSDPMADYSVYGCTASGHLVRYAFNDGQSEDIGHINIPGIGDISGVKGTAHVSGHANLFGFWNDPADGNTKLIYINHQNADTAIVGQHLGIGDVTGATVSGLNNVGDLDGTHGQLSGTLNINPNNAPDIEFVLTKADNTGFVTRDDLLLHPGTLPQNGTYFQGQASYIKVKPKGAGNQTTLVLNGATYNLSNNSAHEFSSVNPMNVHVYNDHVNGQGVPMGHWYLEFVGTQDIYVRDSQNGGLFAIQKVEALEDNTVDFHITGGNVIADEDFAAKVTVLGAALNWGGQYDMPVTVKLKVGGTYLDPWGNSTLPVNANVNDNMNPRNYILPNGIYPTGTSISLKATSWKLKSTSYNGASNNHWQTYIAVDSASGSAAVKVLRNGDLVPNIPAYMDQQQILDFIRDYVDQATGKVVLDENQAIFLFENGTTNLTSSAADFQDVVLLVTLAKDVADLADDDDDDSLNNIASRLIKVHPFTGGYEQIMTMNRDYDGLAAVGDGTFYATMGHEIYRLDPFTQTETLIGSTAQANVHGLEMANSNLFGFTIDSDVLTMIDALTGQQIGSATAVGATDVETIVFIQNQLFSEAYD